MLKIKPKPKINEAQQIKLTPVVMLKPGGAYEVSPFRDPLIISLAQFVELYVEQRRGSAVKLGNKIETMTIYGHLANSWYIAEPA